MKEPIVSKIPDLARAKTSEIMTVVKAECALNQDPHVVISHCLTVGAMIYASMAIAAHLDDDTAVKGLLETLKQMRRTMKAQMQ